MLTYYSLQTPDFRLHSTLFILFTDLTREISWDTNLLLETRD